MRNTEEWKDVPEYEGLYQVSNFGRVKSLKGRVDKILKPTPNTGRYLLVQLYKNKERKSWLVHRLVLSTFKPTPQGQTHHLSILTVDSVSEIKRLYYKNIIINKSELARVFGCAESTIRQVINGDTWKDV